MLDGKPIYTLFGPAVLAVAAGIWTFVTYEDQVRIAFRKPIIDKTVDLCFEVSDLVGKLVSESVETEWQKNKVDFARLYYGKLVMIENTNVSAAMVILNSTMTGLKFEDRFRLRSGALRVSGACRDQIQDLMSTEWKIAPYSGIRTNVESPAVSNGAFGQK